MHLRVCDTCTFWVVCGASSGAQIYCFVMSLEAPFLHLSPSAVCDGSWRAVCRWWMFIFFFFFSLSSRESACLFFSFCFSNSIPIIFYHLFFFHKPFRKVFNVFDLVLKLQSIIYYFFLIRSLFFWFWFFFYLALLLKFCWFQFHTLIKIYVVLFFKIYSSFFWFPFSLVKVFFSFRFNSPI